MDTETFKRQKAFAGEKKASMQRRCVGHDYTGRQMYMVTMVTEGRRPLFGQVVGRSDGQAGSADEPRCVLSELGEAVKNEWWGIPGYYPEVEIVALQMMPDHLHGILFVTRKMEVHIGHVLGGFKTGCNRHFRRLHGVPYVAAKPQLTEPPQQAARRPPEGKRDRSRDDRRHGLLFAPGYNDRLLLRAGQLDTWLNYLRDNPRRLLLKREHPDLFRVQRNVQVAGLTFSAIGNLFLALRPLRMQVQCSRRMTEADIEAYKQRMLAAARGGAVLVSPSISPGEKTVMRAAFDEGLPLIFLQENGFTDLAKPGGRRMEACSRGQLLILAPWEHHNEHTTISRRQCLDLNLMAKMISDNNQS